MIIIKKADKFDSCLSCGSMDNLNGVHIKRSEDANGSTITLCDACIASIKVKNEKDKETKEA